MKRRAPCDVQEAVNDTEEEQQDLGKVSTKEEIAQRKILKIKGPKSAGQADGGEQTEVKFKLNENLQQVPASEDNQNKTYSFLGNNNDKPAGGSLFDNSKIQAQPDEKKEEIQQGKAVEISDAEKMKVAENLEKISKGEQQIQSSGLFNNSKSEQPKTGGLFDNSKETKPSGGLFSNIPTSTSGSTGLFGGKPASSGGLFSNNDNNNQSGGLFSNTTGSTGLFSKPAEGAAPSGGLFSNNNTAPASGGLFSNNTAGTGSGLFQNLSGQQNNTLFANKPATGAAGEEGEEEDDGEDNQVSGQNTPEIDKDQTVKFEYQDIMERIVEKQILKFKKNQGETQDKGAITIEKLKGQENAQAIVVFRNHLKQIMYQGNLIKKLSTFKNLNNKPQNIMVQTIVETTDKEGKKKFDRDTLKIQFENAEDGNDFKAALEKELN